MDLDYHSKRINSIWADQRPAAVLLNVFSKGLDKDQLKKLAVDPALLVIIPEIKPERGYSFVHLVTLGSGDYYGPNLWGDYFNEDEQVVKAVDGSGKKRKLDGGLKKYHSTFRKYGRVYRNHRTTRDGAKPQGDIVWEGYNTNLHRGELVIKLPNALWEDDLALIAEGKPTYWSMGCGVPYDICSICLYERVPKDPGCEHLQDFMLAVHDSGQQVYAINDRPRFFDISRVPSPADRVAISICKVASAPSGVQPGTALGQWAYRDPKRERLFKKLAAFEERPDPIFKEIALSYNYGSEEERLLDELCSTAPPEALIPALNELHCVLPPRIFMKIVLRRPEHEIDPACDILPFICQLLQEYPMLLQEVLTDRSYVDMDSPMRYNIVRDAKSSKWAEVVKLLSAHPEAVRVRIIRAVVRKPEQKETDEKQEKEKSKKAFSPTARVLATEYLKYLLSVPENVPTAVLGALKLGV